MLKSEAPQRDVEQRRRLERLLAGQKRILEMLVGDEPLDAVLGAITSLVEKQGGSMICSIMAVNDDGKTLRCAAPGSLPADYVQALTDIPIGPEMGSCGTAAHLKRRVVTRDISVDPKWQSHASLATRHGLHACWSQPVFDTDGQVLGTVALYQCEPCEPTEEHFELIDMAVRLVAICLRRARANRRLRESLRRAVLALDELQSKPGLPPEILTRLSEIRADVDEQAAVPAR